MKKNQKPQQLPPKSKKQRKQEKIKKKRQQKVIEKQHDIADINEDDSQGNDQEQVDDLDLNHQLKEQQVMDVQFLVMEISEKHYHSMKTILERFSKNTKILSSDWADAMIKNKALGNLVDIEEDDQDEDEQENQQGNDIDEEENLCYGLINLLPFKDKQYGNIITKVKEKIEKSFKGVEDHHSKSGKQISFFLNRAQSQPFLLVNERAINLPAFVAVNMHKVLVNDVKQQFKNPKNTFVVVISQIEKLGKNQKVNEPEKFVYSKFEDYEMMQQSELWWLGEVMASSYRKNDMQTLYYVISLQQYFEVAEKVLDKLLIQ